MNYEVGQIVKYPASAGERFGIKDWIITQRNGEYWVIKEVDNNFWTDLITSPQRLNKYNEVNK